MMEKSPDTPDSPMTDQEIDALIRQVVLSDPPVSRDASSSSSVDSDSGHLSPLWYLGVFLLGMTVTEGLRVMIPPLQEVRGETHHRCGGYEVPNPAEPETVAWTPD